MRTSNISQQELDNLIEDVRYFEDEITALQYVIEEIPYAENTPSQSSIAEMLLKLDHGQKYYYKPILEKAAQKEKPFIDARRLGNYEDSFEFNESDIKNIQERLQKIVKHRASLVNAMQNIHLIDWKKTVKFRSNEHSLFEFIQNMVKKERRILKTIADRVMVHSKEKMNRREMNMPDNKNSDEST